MLSFLAGGSEPFAPAKARVGVPLNGSQWAMVANLEEQLAQWSPFELWAESLKCGRKGLELSDMIRDLEVAAKAFGAPPYATTASPPPATAPPRGFIRVVADRMKIPAEPPSVDLQQWLSPGMWMAFVEPQSLVSWPHRPATWARPRPRRLGPEAVSYTHLTLPTILRV